MADIMVETRAYPIQEVAPPGNNGKAPVVTVIQMTELRDADVETREEKHERLLDEARAICEGTVTEKLYGLAIGITKEWTEELGEQAQSEIGNRVRAGDEVAITTRRILENKELCKDLNSRAEIREPAMREIVQRVERDSNARYELDKRMADLILIGSTTVVEEVFHMLGEQGGTKSIDLILNHIRIISPKEEEGQMPIRTIASEKEEDESVVEAAGWMYDGKGPDNGNVAVLEVVKIASRIAKTNEIKAYETAARLRRLGYISAANCILEKIGGLAPMKRTLIERLKSFGTRVKQDYQDPKYKKEVKVAVTH